MRDFLAADLIDVLHVVQVPILLGRGVRLWDGLEGIEERFDVEVVSSPSGVAHDVHASIVVAIALEMQTMRGGPGRTCGRRRPRPPGAERSDGGDEVRRKCASSTDDAASSWLTLTSKMILTGKGHDPWWCISEDTEVPAPQAGRGTRPRSTGADVGGEVLSVDGA